MLSITHKRAYEPPAVADGARVLVDRIWPRGLSKEKLKLDAWYKEIAPGTELRKWFNHDPARWEEFCQRYQMELQRQQSLAQGLLKESKNNKITLVYGAKDERHNHALVLQKFLEDQLHHRKN